MTISASPESDNAVLRSDISSSPLHCLSPHHNSHFLSETHQSCLHTHNLRHKPLSAPCPQCRSRHNNLSSIIRHESSGANFKPMRSLYLRALLWTMIGNVELLSRAAPRQYTAPEVTTPRPRHSEPSSQSEPSIRASDQSEAGSGRHEPL